MTSEVMPAASSDDFKMPPTIFDPTTCARKGLCPVTQIRNQAEPLESHSLYYEIHGSGPEKVVFIMGCVHLSLFPRISRVKEGLCCRLNTTSASWLPQVDYFGRKSEYSVIVFDNRGVGNSDTPRGPYT